MDARSIVSGALSLRRSHPAAPLVEVFDVLLQGAAGQVLDFSGAASPSGTLMWPTSPFGQLVAEVFDPVMPPGDWGLIDLPDPGLREKMHALWCAEVLPKIEARYRVTLTGCRARQSWTRDQGRTSSLPRATLGIDHCSPRARSLCMNSERLR